VPAAISTRSKSRATPLALLLHFVAADAGAMIDINQWVVYIPIPSAAAAQTAVCVLAVE